MSTAGSRFRAALAAEQPLQIRGALTASHALLAKRAGSPCLPDLGITTRDDHHKFEARPDALYQKNKS